MKALSESGNGLKKLRPEYRKRWQSLFKHPMFCHCCENEISKYEQKFSEKVYVPYWKSGASTFGVGPWLFKFLVSLSFKTALYTLHNSDYAISDKTKSSIEKAKSRWKKFLIGEAEDVGCFKQYLLVHQSSAGVRNNKKNLFDVKHAELLTCNVSVSKLKNPSLLAAMSAWPGFLAIGMISPSIDPIQWSPLKVTTETESICAQECQDKVIKGYLKGLRDDLRKFLKPI